ncbi:MAG TPA: IS1595 family transposase [Nitrospira sp.]|nr:IS1595 family transposase [Nitrospira sp.]
MSEPKLPTTLQEAIKYFADSQRCLDFAIAMRWPQGPTCPRCHSQEYRFIKTRSVWVCKHCKKQYSVKVGTIFEDSPIKLDKWLCAMWMMVNAKNGISSYEVHRSLGVTQKTAWFMLYRIRLALQNGSLDRKLMGDVEVDETYIGGQARNMHKDKAIKMKQAEGFFRKAVVIGMLERKGEVRTAVLNRASTKLIEKAVKENVVPGSNLYSDQLNSYLRVGKEYAHKIINPAVTFPHLLHHRQRS